MVAHGPLDVQRKRIVRHFEEALFLLPILSVILRKKHTPKNWLENKEGTFYGDSIKEKRGKTNPFSSRVSARIIL